MRTDRRRLWMSLVALLVFPLILVISAKANAEVRYHGDIVHIRSFIPGAVLRTVSLRRTRTMDQSSLLPNTGHSKRRTPTTRSLAGTRTRFSSAFPESKTYHELSSEA